MGLAGHRGSLCHRRVRIIIQEVLWVFQSAGTDALLHALRSQQCCMRGVGAVACFPAAACSPPWDLALRLRLACRLVPTGPCALPPACPPAVLQCSSASPTWRCAMSSTSSAELAPGISHTGSPGCPPYLLLPLFSGYQLSDTFCIVCCSAELLPCPAHQPNPLAIFSSCRQPLQPTPGYPARRRSTCTITTAGWTAQYLHLQGPWHLFFILPAA